MEKQRVNKRRERREKSSQAIKIVIRHLPPTMTEEEFLQQVEPLPENDAYYYCQADWSLGQEATCRAYIDMSMKDMSEVLQFRDRFDGYVFVDARGVEYIAIVEYAPFQCFLKNKGRSQDYKMNTIEKEPHYQEYLQRMADEREEASRLCDTKIDFTFDQKSDEKVKSTPLLQYLANKKEKRREEARKRNEEKKKSREEQKQQRAFELPEAGKQKDALGDNNKKSVNSNNPKKGFGHGGGQGQGQGQAQEEATENSRSKRRTERNQRRREEHEQRKLGRERDNRDKNTNDRQEKVTVQKRPSNQPAKRDQQKKNEEFVILKKEAKPVENAVASKTETVKSLEAGSKRETAETSKRPKEIVKSESIDEDPCVLPSTNKAISSVISNEQGASKEPAENYKRSKEIPKSGSGQEHSIQPNTSSSKANNSRLAEERRIRNKDRPSIAIYQPKVRMRMDSDDTSPTDCKDSAPTFERDTFFQDNKPTNKRYNRRNRQKPQDNAEQARGVVSKPSESSTSSAQ
ncbi:regulator of nonsense transcripts 3B [Drosophila grimshawi]|uniref:GH21690 n=1 Tax=Drosophila grimshawi TaxID=7222 RepID=B4J641_DROGR|nr:regulator of nonsense transcripts 3B [Drosophila grimshawi]EDW01899.1 GH21690 [Drosophila grimshawi]